MARVGLGLLALPLVQGRAVAQSRFEVSPSLALSEIYDDNIFATPAEPEADYIWRLSPRLGIGRRSSRLRLNAQYGLDAEVFRKHPELNSVTAGQQAALDVEWSMSPLVAFTATATYASAQTAGELNTLTGLQAGRLPSRQFLTTEALSRRLGARTKATLDHHFTRQVVASYPDNEMHAITFGLERRLWLGDLGRVAYSARRHAFGSEPIMAHVVTLGWTREVTSLVHLEFDAGPSLTGQTVGAEVTAALRRRFRKGDAGLAYVHTQTTVLGEPGLVTVEGVTATFSRQIGSLRVGVGPSFFRVLGQDSESTVRRLGTEVTWRLTRQLSLAASHQFTLQRGGLGLARGTDTEIAHNTLLVGLAARSAGR